MNEWHTNLSPGKKIRYLCYNIGIKKTHHTNHISKQRGNTQNNGWGRGEEAKFIIVKKKLEKKSHMLTVKTLLLPHPRLPFSKKSNFRFLFMDSACSCPCCYSDLILEVPLHFFLCCQLILCKQ